MVTSSRRVHWRTAVLWGAVYCATAGLAACGSSSTSSSSGSSDSGGSGGSGGGSGGSSTTEFTMKGTLSSLTVSSLSTDKAATSGTVTDVMAISPETSNTSCKTAQVGTSGAFELGLTGQRPWMLYFFNRQQRGSSMFMGRFRSSTLDTLPPADAYGSLDLATVTVDGSTGTATSSKAHSEILSGLNIDSETADSVGELDDIARRYANPDIDEDGEIDCAQSSRFLLDFHIRFDVKKSGAKISVTDLIGSFLDTATTTVAYSSTGVYVAYPKTFASVETGSVTFVESAVITEEAGSVAANTATSSVTTNNFGDFYGFGPNLTDKSELPRGKIVFAFGGKTLTFPDVQTPTLDSLKTPTGRIFPFVKFIKSDAACTSNCTLSGVGYQWMKKTATGWKAASTTDLKLLVDSDGGFISFRVNNSASRTVSFTIPVSSVDGTIDWKATSASLSGVTAAELLTLVTTQICHIGLSYDDKLGMRYFQNIDNATGTCS